MEKCASIQSGMKASPWVHTKTQEGGILLRKAQELLAIPIYTLSDGREIGKVHDLLFNTSGYGSPVLIGVLLEPKTLFHEGRYLPWSSVIKIGEDALFIADPLQIKDALFPEPPRFLKGEPSVLKKTVLTTHGNHLGEVEDVYIDLGTGKLVGYEIGAGVVRDMMEGRLFIDAQSQHVLNDETLIVALAQEP